jgi:hypothetical protein
MTETQAYLNYLRAHFNLFSWEPVTGFYNPNLWTIPVEFRCSMVVFLTVLGLTVSNRCQTRHGVCDYGVWHSLRSMGHRPIHVRNDSRRAALLQERKNSRYELVGEAPVLGEDG